MRITPASTTDRHAALGLLPAVKDHYPHLGRRWLLRSPHRLDHPAPRNCPRHRPPQRRRPKL
ncbi:hypothetical protein [Streptomyces sp. NPDC057877]|uniref:hypothetical protein n=1 Tax=Streptomyces sp. NPDC057877 TaxID=3346269 RepID=UPI003685AEC2